MLYVMYNTLFLSVFLLGENIGGVMETTVKCLITVAQLPLQNNLGGSSSPSVVMEQNSQHLFIHCCLPLAASPHIH